VSRARRRPGLNEAAEAHGPDERWMASYMDMVTVLMCTFIVLFSMSTVNAHKFDELKNSLQTGFGEVISQKVDTAKGVVVPAKDASTAPAPQAPTPLQQAAAEVADLRKVEAAIDSRLSALGLQGSVSYSIDARGLTIGLVGGNTFFDSNLASLTPMATQIIGAIGPVLNATPYSMSIEGHADARPPGPPYVTNWDLAAARAIAVLRQLTDQSGIPAQRIYAVSDGSASATATGADPAQLAHDRRVDIVVRSSKAQAVRDLIPQIVAAQGGGK
jgi:chemotaxis protein MotB